MPQTKIVAIAQAMAKCPTQCPDTLNDRRIGALPRSLFLEDASGKVSADPNYQAVLSGKGAVAVGLNPGRSSCKERAHYLASSCTYNSQVDWYNLKGSAGAYYNRLRRIIQDMGRAEILWTELAKCENQPDGSNPDVPTLRHCTGRYLQHEIGALNGDWLLIGIGKEAWRALAYRYPSRAIIGIPHPTGSFGHFRSIIDSKGKLYPCHVTAVQNAIANNAAVWLK